jgi:hypothetical protein
MKRELPTLCVTIQNTTPCNVSYTERFYLSVSYNIQSCLVYVQYDLRRLYFIFNYFNIHSEFTCVL